jgi:L-ascorbate metabolism protein UlaG (beta-lactamase superfamily)
MQILAKKGGSFLVTTQHNKEAVKITIGENVLVEDFEITGPGEYEIRGVFVQGVAPLTYTLEIEGIRVCYLGDIKEQELGSEHVEKIGNIDVLITPTTGGKKNVVSQIEPRILVQTEKVKGVEPQQKLTLKKKDFTSEETATVVLSV